MAYGLRWAERLPCSLTAYGYGAQETGHSNSHASFSNCSQKLPPSKQQGEKRIDTVLPYAPARVDT